ncbi:MAG TPA: PD-(D/E)XK nuclease family protein [Anaerolineales bacterium]|jgi:hypothetical protein
MTAKTAAKPIRKDGPSGRFYEVEGELYPSVTHILGAIAKPALVNWAANQERSLVSAAAADLFEQWAAEIVPPKMPRESYLATLLARLGQVKAHQKELAKAGEIGTQTHQLIEWTMRTALGADAGPKPIVSDKALWGFMAFEDWAKSVALKPVLIEQTVYSKTHQYAGTMDLLGRVNGVMTLIDIKTSRAVYPEAHLQAAAYQVALIEMGYVAPAAGLIVRLPKTETDPAFEVVTVPPVTDLFPVFLAVKELWKWSYANEAAYRARREAVA